MSDPGRTNNFDLLRLLAAFQVVVLHAAGHLEIPMSETVKEVLRLFPGVPIFFTISGFLIFQSYERSSGNLHKYFFNRALRIYPGLVATYLLGFGLILIFAPHLNAKDLAVWSAGQLTLAQFWTPDSLRSYGVGTPNGALWTIPVEIQFYVLLPALYYLWRKYGAVALVVPLALSIASYFIVFATLRPETTAYKLFMVLVLPYLFNFLVGVFLAAYFGKVAPLLIGQGLYWLAGFTTINIINLFSLHLWVSAYNPTTFLGIVSLVTLSITVISLAYTWPSLSARLLRGNDISYGIYIYHMPIVNAMVQQGYVRTYSYLGVTLLLTTGLAILSWNYLEKPFLRMKQRRPAPFVAAKMDVQW